ncbi:MAG: thioredoxin family protein [Halobacteriales archaeon]|nr:thioredoxin family protein [Halobacteriales archaeon]
MDESNEVTEIRDRKRQRLLESLEGGGTAVDGGETAPTEPIHIEGAAHLDEVTGTYDVVLVDFYADWCGPCQMLEPVVRELARETAAAVAKVDIDRHQAIAQQAGIRGVPTLFVYADGELRERLVGVQDPGRLQNLIDRYAA